MPNLQQMRMVEACRHVHPRTNVDQDGTKSHRHRVSISFSISQRSPTPEQSHVLGYGHAEQSAGFSYWREHDSQEPQQRHEQYHTHGRRKLQYPSNTQSCECVATAARGPRSERESPPASSLFGAPLVFALCRTYLSHSAGYQPYFDKIGWFIYRFMKTYFMLYRKLIIRIWSEIYCTVNIPLSANCVCAHKNVPRTSTSLGTSRPAAASLP